MSLGLTAILYFYMKQKLYVIETRLNTLTDLTQTLANEFCKSGVKTISNLPLDLPTLNIEESENDSETDSENDSESDDESNSSDESDAESTCDLHPESENKITELNNEIYKEVIISDNVNIEVVKLIDEVVKLTDEVELPIPQLNTKILPIDLNETSNNLIEVSDDESVTKHVNVSVDYSTLSLKDLKQKVNDLGGPPLKTKNALLNFLKNKV
jgi:hypothetical protein